MQQKQILVVQNKCVCVCAYMCVCPWLNISPAAMIAFYFAGNLDTELVDDFSCGISISKHTIDTCTANTLVPLMMESGPSKLIVTTRQA